MLDVLEHYFDIDDAKEKDTFQTIAFFILVILLALVILRWRLEDFRKEVVLVFIAPFVSSLETNKDRDDPHNRLELQRKWLKISFAFVHALLFGFAWMAHGFPSAFFTQPWPWTSEYVWSYWHQPFLYVLLTAILMITVWRYLKVLDRKHR